MHPTLAELFDEHVASSFDKQMHLSDLVGSSDWQFDAKAGVLSFDRVNWHVQVLGTQSDQSRTWLWAWANDESGLQEGVLAASETLHGYGLRQGVPELAKPKVTLRPGLDGHFFSMIACGVLSAKAYYRAPYEGGAAYLLIDDPQFPIKGVNPLARITEVFPQVVSHFECDHRRALAAYAAFYGLTAHAAGDRLVIEDGGAVIIARLDAGSRLAEIRLGPRDQVPGN